MTEILYGEGEVRSKLRPSYSYKQPYRKQFAWDWVNPTGFRMSCNLNFDVLLTVHLSIFISVFNQLDAQNLLWNKFCASSWLNTEINHVI